jgi:hypothetical protein
MLTWGELSEQQFTATVMSSGYMEFITVLNCRILRISTEHYILYQHKNGYNLPLACKNGTMSAYSSSQYKPGSCLN